MFTFNSSSFVVPVAFICDTASKLIDEAFTDYYDKEMFKAIMSCNESLTLNLLDQDLSLDPFLLFDGRPLSNDEILGRLLVTCESLLHHRTDLLFPEGFVDSHKRKCTIDDFIPIRALKYDIVALCQYLNGLFNVAIEQPVMPNAEADIESEVFDVVSKTPGVDMEMIIKHIKRNHGCRVDKQRVLTALDILSNQKNIESVKQGVHELWYVKGNAPLGPIKMDYSAKNRIGDAKAKTGIALVSNFVKANVISENVKYVDKIIDFGIGRGGDVGKYATANGKLTVYGLDIRDDLLLECERRAQEVGLNVKVNKMDFTVPGGMNCRNIPNVDLAISNFAAQYAFRNLKSLYGFFSNVRDSLRPGGRFVCICVDPARIEQLYKLGNKHVFGKMKIVFSDRTTDIGGASIYSYDIEITGDFSETERSICYGALMKACYDNDLELVEKRSLSYYYQKQYEGMRKKFRVTSKTFNEVEDAMKLYSIFVFTKTTKNRCAEELFKVASGTGYLKSKSTYLDVNCGDGNLSFAFGRMIDACSVYGVHQGAVAGPPNVSFIHADAHGIFPQLFEVITVCHAFHNIIGIDRYINMLFKGTDHGGLVVVRDFSVYTMQEHADVKRHCMENLSRYGVPVEFFSFQQINAKMCGVGYECVNAVKTGGLWGEFIATYRRPKYVEGNELVDKFY